MPRNLSLALASLLAVPIAACLDASGSDDGQMASGLVAPTVSETAEAAALPTWPANPNWQSLVLGPASDDVRPVRVVRTVGSVSNTGVLVGQGTGTASLTVPQGGRAGRCRPGLRQGGRRHAVHRCVQLDRVVRHREDLDQ